MLAWLMDTASLSDALRAPTAWASVISCFLVSLRTPGSLGAAPGLMIVQKVPIKGGWVEEGAEKAQLSRSENLGDSIRSRGQRLCVPASRACSFPPWRPEATAITAL